MARLAVRRSGAAEGAVGAPGNAIGDAGAVALAKALESGQCALTSLNLRCKIVWLYLKLDSFSFLFCW